jgi:hypothetical protein
VLVVLQWSHEFKNFVSVMSNKSEGDCTLFWYRCHEAFCEAGVSPKHAADFFKEHSVMVSTACKERYLIRIMCIIFHCNIIEPRTKRYLLYAQITFYEVSKNYLSC